MRPEALLAQAFANAIMKPLVLIPSHHSTVIRGVMRDVPSPYTSRTEDIVIREVDHEFWTHLLWHRLSHRRKRVAVVGTPGIGKTITTAYAIQCLLKECKTVY